MICSARTIGRIVATNGCQNIETTTRETGSISNVFGGSTHGGLHSTWVM